MSIYVIGDVHGCYDEFISLLNEIKYNEEDDTLILLGDLFDRGPKPDMMLKWVLNHIDNPNILYIRGNHELMMLSDINDYTSLSVKDEKNSDWLDNGGKRTREILLEKTTPEERNQVFDFLNNEAFLYLDVYCKGQRYIIVHAGLYPPYPRDIISAYHVPFTQEYILEKAWLTQEVFDLTWVRSEWLFSTIFPPFKVIFGHTPTYNIWYSASMFDHKGDEFPFEENPLNEAISGDVYSVLEWNNKIALDTGCFMGGRLSAYCLDDETVVQVDASKSTIANYIWSFEPLPDEYVGIINDQSMDLDDYFFQRYHLIASHWHDRLKELDYLDLEDENKFYIYGPGKNGAIREDPFYEEEHSDDEDAWKCEI